MSSEMESLVYNVARSKFDAFVKFVKNGKTKPGTDQPEEDDQGAAMTGVIAWLVGELQFDNRFFSNRDDAEAGDNVTFVVMQQKRDPLIPWTSIPGFTGMIQPAGATITFPKQTLRLSSVKELDDALRERVKRFKALPVGLQKELRPVLKGDKDAVVAANAVEGARSMIEDQIKAVLSNV